MREYAKQFKQLLNGDLRRTRTFLKKMSPGEIGHLIETSLPQQRSLVWQLVEKDARGDVLVFLSEDVRQQLIDTMNMDQLSAVLDELEDDDLADILQQLPDRILEEYLSGLESIDRDRIESLLSYPEHSAGGLMNPEIISVRPDTNVDVIKRFLRRKEPLEQLEFVYVTNTKNRLMGALPISRLINAEDENTATDLMIKNIDMLPVSATAEQVIRKFEDKARIEVAVVDSNNALLGRITFDDVFDLIREQGEKQRVSFAGGDKGEIDIYASVRSSFLSRGVWLGINLATAFIAAAVIGLFEHTIEKVVALAVLMPVVASMGGIAGTQTLTIMVRGYAREQINHSNLWWLLSREVRLGVINGCIWSLVVSIIATLWFNSLLIGLVIAVAMVVNLCLAAVVGVFLPAALRTIKVDPAVSGGVILTTFTDVCGFITFLGLATLLFI